VEEADGTFHNNRLDLTSAMSKWNDVQKEIQSFAVRSAGEHCHQRLPVIRRSAHVLWHLLQQAREPLRQSVATMRAETANVVYV